MARPTIRISVLRPGLMVPTDVRLYLRREGQGRSGPIDLGGCLRGAGPGGLLVKLVIANGARSCPSFHLRRSKPIDGCGPWVVWGDEPPPPRQVAGHVPRNAMRGGRCFRIALRGTNGGHRHTATGPAGLSMQRSAYRPSHSTTRDAGAAPPHILSSWTSTSPAQRPRGVVSARTHAPPP